VLDHYNHETKSVSELIRIAIHSLYWECPIFELLRFPEMSQNRFGCFGDIRIFERRVKAFVNDLISCPPRSHAARAFQVTRIQVESLV
jgi:hypothetical protein